MHESWRLRLIGQETEPLDRNPKLALTLLVTMPSGRDEVCTAKDEVAALMMAAPPRPIRCPATRVISVHGCPVPMPFNFIYIGHGPDGGRFPASPWGNPFVDYSDVACEFPKYAAERADSVQWSAPLRNKTWVCHCNEALAFRVLFLHLPVRPDRG